MSFAIVLNILKALSESKVLKESDRDLLQFLSNFDIDVPHVDDLREWVDGLATQGEKNLVIASKISDIEDTSSYAAAAILAALAIILAVGGEVLTSGEFIDASEFPSEITNSSELLRAAVGGSNYTVVSKFGADRSWNRASGHGTHQGADIHVPYGTPISAVFDGTVTVAKFLATPDGSGCHSTAGNWIEITSFDGKWKARYMHLSAVNVKPGDKVSYGQKIGAAGWSGYVKGGSQPYKHTESFVHVHFEILHNGRHVDPESIGSELPKAQMAAYQGSLKSVDAEFSSKKDRISFIMNYLQGKGLSVKQAAAVAGNLMQESRLDYAPGMKWYQNTESGATGIAQWLGSRKTEYKAWVRKHGGKEDLKTSMDFLWHELQTSEKSSLTKLQGGGSVESIAVSFGKAFERYGSKEEGDRAKYARYVFDLYSTPVVKPKKAEPIQPTAELDVDQYKATDQPELKSSFARNDFGESIFNCQNFSSLGHNFQSYG